MKPEILLKAYVLHKSEDAFRELVADSLPEVYSAALRIVQGPPHLAEETVLRVYWELARKAPTLGEEVRIASWLREHTCKMAVKVLHEEDRPVDRAVLKKERQAGSGEVQAPPPGLATRVCLGIFLNAARQKGFRLVLPRGLWPAWLRPVPAGAAAVCLLGMMLWWKVPFHPSHRIVAPEEMQLTPGSFAQLAATDGDGGAAPSDGPGRKAQTNPNAK